MPKPRATPRVPPRPLTVEYSAMPRPTSTRVNVPNASAPSRATRLGPVTTTVPAGTHVGVELLDDDVLVGVGGSATGSATGSAAGSARASSAAAAAVASSGAGVPAAVVSSGSGEPAALSGLSCDMSILS